jgi:hypothetical protein
VEWGAAQMKVKGGGGGGVFIAFHRSLGCTWMAPGGSVPEHLWVMSLGIKGWVLINVDER